MSDTVRDAARFQRPVARLLRPLVRLLLRQGITFPALSDMLRELYVNVAEHEFRLPGKEQTDSRVSLLTGIHRKEVRRLRGAGTPVAVVPASLSRTSSILARWLAAPEFTDEAGEPLALPRTAEGAAPSFDALVASVTRDVRPRAVLDEWLDRAIVRIDREDRVVLTEAAFLPRGGDEEQLHYFGRNLHDHIAAAAANVAAGAPVFFERAVHYDGLSQGAAEALERSSRQLAARALRVANRDAYAAAPASEDGNWRWIFGVYILAERGGESAGPEEPLRAQEDGP
ncbi:DUF6502 family protein [Labrys wisconsinensis]|uniref:Uncharacterized protein n=1 Tax=Labrys wisconsinensis TaxID=425677 RepID=A0ABU0JG99_9HYPH|nr:DUF6502 family protein [Labrys wisconsinensis]MDQ0473319.1 hypothetical protein [Labrys wisconsinensis]